MAEFRYEAINQSGAFRSGMVSAGTLRQAIDQLTERGLHVRRVEPIRSNEESLEVTDFLTPLSDAAAENVVGLLSDAISAELPLEPALRAAAEESQAKERRVLTRIADDIAAGVPTDEAFMRSGEALPSHLLAIILAGLESGDLARILSRYLTLSRQRSEARRVLTIALAYPVVLLFGMSLAFLFLMIFIVPGFEQILNDFGSKIPFVTSVVLATSRFIRSVWWPLLAAAMVVGVLFAMYAAVMRRRGMSLAALPVVDLFVRSADWGRFCGLLGLLVESRQPLPQALRLASASAITLRVRGAGLAIAEDVEAGLTPWEAALPRTIPGPIRQVFRWADRADVFAEALAGLAELYSRRARVSAGLIAVIIEPFVLIFMAATIGSVVVAIFLPLIQLLNDLS